MEGIDDDPMEGIESTTVDDGKAPLWLTLS